MLALFIPWGSDGEVFKTYDSFTKVRSRDKLSDRLLIHVKNFNLLMKSREVVMEEQNKTMKGNELLKVMQMIEMVGRDLLNRI